MFFLLFEALIVIFIASTLWSILYEVRRMNKLTYMSHIAKACSYDITKIGSGDSGSRLFNLAYNCSKIDQIHMNDLFGDITDAYTLTFTFIESKGSLTIAWKKK